MKIIFLSLLMIPFNTLFAQDTLTNTIAKNVCSCLNDKINKGAVTYKDAVNCVNIENEAQSELYENEGIKIYGESTTQNQAIQYAKQVGLKVSLQLINSCPLYRKLMDTARYSLYNYLNKDSLLLKIHQLNSIDLSRQDLNFYTTRAKMEFWISDLKAAADDAVQILKKDSTNQLGRHIIAMQLEKDHKYESAFKIYTSLYNMSNNPRYAIDAALVKWKIEH